MINIDLRCCDCIDLMSEFTDNHFDFAIVDPPYGINIVTLLQGEQKKANSFLRGCNGITGGEWDNNIPNQDYFVELRRVSKHQIIWGGNYFLEHLGPAPCFFVWDKVNGSNYMADVELAWTSLDGSSRLFAHHHFSSKYQRKMHPTQKPVELYDWIFSKFIPTGSKILDTHMGSGSIAISAYHHGMELVAAEIDKGHYDRALARITEEIQNPRPNRRTANKHKHLGLKINNKSGKLCFVVGSKFITQQEGIKLAQKILGITRKELCQLLGYKNRGLDTYYLKTGAIMPERLFLKILKALK